MQQLVGPCAVAAALQRFASDDDMAAAGAAACVRSLDIIEKVAAAHEGGAAQVLMRTCVQLLLASGLPLQLFRCFCARAVSLDSFDQARPRCQLLLQLLSATCRCIHVAAACDADVPLSLTAGIAERFAPPIRPHDGQSRCVSATDLMSLMLAQPRLDAAANAALLLMSILLSHCISSTLLHPDTSLLFPVALHVMHHDPLSLITILTPRTSAPHLPPPLTSHACASLLLALASSSAPPAAAATAAANAAATQSFTLLLLRFALIHFARDSPAPAPTSHLYQHVLALIATAIERLPPGAVDARAARPLLVQLAAHDGCDATVELAQLFTLHVMKDDAKADACAAVLQAALDAAHKAAAADAAVELLQGGGGRHAAASALEPVAFDAGDKVLFSLKADTCTVDTFL
jgi:hypothetical protein